MDRMVSSVLRFLVPGLIIFSVATSRADAALDLEESQNSKATGFIGRRHVYRGMIMYLRAANADSLLRATFLSDQAAFHAIAEECGFVPRGARVYSRKAEPSSVSSRFVSATFAEVEFEDCEHAKIIKNNLKLRTRFENGTVAKDQRLYDEYLREELLREGKRRPEPATSDVSIRERAARGTAQLNLRDDLDDVYLD